MVFVKEHRVGQDTAENPDLFPLRKNTMTFHVVIDEQLSTCRFIFWKLRHPNVFHHFSNTPSIFFADCPSPDESSGPSDCCSFFPYSML